MKFPIIGNLRRRTTPPINDYPAASYQGAYQTLTQGGFQNPQTGAGFSGLDRAETAFWSPTWYWSRQSLQTIYVQSWAAAHFIDIPIDDMFVRWRQWEGGAEADTMRDAEHLLDVREQLARAMKAARLYGTGLLIPISKDAPLVEPLLTERIRAGDVTHLLVFDRYSANVREWDIDPLSPTYGQALLYDIYPHTGRPFAVHHTRVIRFDAIRPFGNDGFTIYDRNWGVSAIVPVIIALIQDQSGASAAGQLMQIASMDVVRMTGFRDAVVGQQEIDDPSPESVGDRMNLLKSVYRTIFMDKEDEFTRQSVSFAGLPDMLDRMAKRVAAAAQIPATRFWGQSPVGMNATGESDMVNYAQSVMAMQDKMLRAPLRKLDLILARNAGLREAPDFRWLPLTDMSESEKATTLQTKVTALASAITAGIIDEDEARRALDGDELLGELPGSAPGPLILPDDAGMDDGDTNANRE